MGVRVRFAPAPTGPLHLGSVMSAVANYVFARHARGAFVLRVDDTDEERSHRRYERSIHQDAEWLGLRFDEGPVFPESYRYLEDRGITFVREVCRAEAVEVLELYRRSSGVIYNP